MSRLKFVKFTQFPSKKRFNSTFLLIFTKILKNHIICNDIKRKLFMRIILSTESVKIRYFLLFLGISIRHLLVLTQIRQSPQFLRKKQLNF